MALAPWLLIPLASCVGELSSSRQRPDPRGSDAPATDDARFINASDTDPRGPDAGARSRFDAARDDTSDASLDARALIADAWRPSATDALVAPDASGACTDCACVGADRLFGEDLESGGPRGFTGSSYDDVWGNDCQSTRTQSELTHGGSFAQRSEIVCASDTDVHRGYGGVQFSGDRALSSYTNSGTGIEAPSGMVSTHWLRLHAGYPLGGGRWVSLFTINPSCDYTTRVVTVGIDQADGLLRAAHYWPEGTEQISPEAVPLPLDRWVRLTVYVDLDDGILHVWQDGRSTLHVTGIVRPLRTYCQWHWGLYASGDNTDLVLHEDDFTLHRLHEPWTDWAREPWLGEGGMPTCP